MGRKLLAIITAAMVIGLTQGSEVSAHANLVRAEPAPGGKVKTAPKVVRAWFDDELDPKGSSVSVLDSHGKRVDSGKGGVDPKDKTRKSMIVRLKRLAPGTYTVKWKAFTADDNKTTEGTFRFTVASSTSGSDSEDTPPQPGM